MACLSGFSCPSQSLSAPLQRAAQLLPSTSAIQAALRLNQMEAPMAAVTGGRAPRTPPISAHPPNGGGLGWEISQRAPTCLRIVSERFSINILYKKDKTRTMRRQRSSSPADGLMDLVALLPWWAGVTLAAVSYGVLHAIATRPLQALQPGQVGDVLSTMLWQGLATGGQYLVPFICLLGALASALHRRKRRALFDTASQATSADALQGMSWQEFEMLVGEGFKRRGFGVRETGGGGADGGVDLVLTQGGEKFLVQCKQWKAFKVGVATVRELYGAMAADGATGGFVVTSGRFTRDAEAFSAGRNIQLIDGTALMLLLRDGRAGRAAARAPVPQAAGRAAGSPGQPATAGVEPPTSVDSVLEPSCPRCAKPMVRRVAKRGPGAGKVFWGCSGYSAGCRGTKEIQ